MSRSAFLLFCVGFVVDSFSPSLFAGSTSARSATHLLSSSEVYKGGYDGEFVDEKTKYDSWTHPIKPDGLVDLAKRFYEPEVRFGTKDGGDCLADDFEFCAAVVGPLDKQQYLDALDNFKLEEAFDIDGNVYGFYADPVQEGRVWFFNRAKAKHTGTFVGAEPTGKTLELPPQINFLDFAPDGKVKQYGFYTVDRRQGNTGGLGGAYGYLYGIGRSPPWPEAKPFKPSLRYRVFSRIFAFLSKLSKKKEGEET